VTATIQKTFAVSIGEFFNKKERVDRAPQGRSSVYVRNTPESPLELWLLCRAPAFSLMDAPSGRNRVYDLLACSSASAYPEGRAPPAQRCVTRDGDDPNASVANCGAWGPQVNKRRV
jgi:hypothetical protein